MGDGDIRTSTGQEEAKVFVPMQVGSATVYVQTSSEGARVEDDRIRPVAPVDPRQVFESAGEILRECVRVIGERIENLGDRAKPGQVTVEFSLSFEIKGKASIIPVFVTGESTAQTGLKVTAVWKRSEKQEE